MQNLKALLMRSAALAAMSVVSAPAQAQSYAFGAGDSSLQLVFRQTMDCMYDQAQGSSGKPGPLAKAANCSGFDTSGFHGMTLFAPTGSSNGKLVLRTNDPANVIVPNSFVSSAGYYTGYARIPFTSSNIGVNDTKDYDGVQFVGSFDLVNTNDTADWNAGGTTGPQAKFGNLIQLPAVVGAIAIGGHYGGNLTRNALCGIVSGHITRWDNPILTALYGSVIDSSSLVFVHRQDGSGDTFLLSNALVAQCRYEFGPNNEVDPTIVSYAFPWTDRTQACTSPLVPRGASQLNWPDQFATDQCGNPVANPGGGHFANASGTDNLMSLMASTRGAIGYASLSVWGPVVFQGFGTFNLQSQWDITNNTGKFQPATFAGAQKAMSAQIPQFDSTTRVNPLTWSLQGVNPNPVAPGAYPISGFGWIEMYQCYRNHNTYGGPRASGIPADNNAFLWLKNWLDYLYGTGSTGIQNENGFAQIPTVWQNEIYALLNDPVNGPQGSGCTGKVGAY